MRKYPFPLLIYTACTWASVLLTGFVSHWLIDADFLWLHRDGTIDWVFIGFLYVLLLVAFGMVEAIFGRPSKGP